MEGGERADPVRRGRRGARLRLEISLEEAIGIALNNNFGLEIARVNRSIQSRLVTIEKAAFDPFFNLSATYSKNRRPSASFLDIGNLGLAPKVVVNPFEVTNYSAGLSWTSVIGTAYTLSLQESGFDRPLAARGGILPLNPQEEVTGSIRLTQPLLRGAWYDYNTGRLRIAQNNERLSLEDLELAASDLVFQVEQAYWQLVFAWKNFEAKEKALAVAAENLDNVRKKRAVGKLADIDVITAESQLSLRKVEHNQAEQVLEEAQDSLLQVINEPGRPSLKEQWEAGRRRRPYGDIAVIPTTEPSADPLLPDLDDALRMAFEERPDYRRMDVEISSKEIELEMARNELLPFLDLTASWQQQGLDDSIEGAFSSLGGGRFYSWSVGVELRLPLGNRAPRAAFLRAREELYRLKLQRAELENRIVLEVEQALRRLELVRERVAALEERVRLQAELLEKERRKLEVGTSIPYTVSIIENDLVESQAQALQAQVDYETAKAEYYRVTGTLLEHYGLEDFLR